MTLVPCTHILRRKTATGYTLNKGLLVPGVGFMMVSPRHEKVDEETGIYRIVRKLNDCEVLTIEDARRRGWLNNHINGRLMFEEAVAAAS